MKATLTSALCSLAMCLAFGASPSFAQTSPPGGPPAPANDAPGRVFLDHDPGHDNIGHAVVVPFGPWMSLSGNFGDGLGWQDGYVNATAFAPLHIDPGTSLMFTTLNLGVAENGRGLLNVGSGYRYYSQGLNRIFGFSAHGDLDDGHEEPFTRVGVSLESLGKYLDYRFNTYYVVGHDHEKVRDSYLTQQPFFQNNFLMLLRERVFENAYSGAEFEVGGQVPFIGRYGFSAYVAPYFLTHQDDTDAFGIKVRAQAQVNEDLTIGATFTNDEVFSNNAYFTVTMNIPDGRPTRWFRPTPMKERLAAPVYREQRIAVHRKIDRKNEPLLNPADGQPFLFAHIDSNATASGNGTIERPYNSTGSFVNGSAYDVVYVRGGNNANLATGVTLFNNQRLLSTAVTHSISGLQGTFAIPGFTGGNLPTLTNPGGTTVVQVAGNNEVSGFQINGTNGVNPLINGITSQPGGSNGGFNINRNVFTNNDNAVNLTVVGSGLGLFTNNNLTGAGVNSNRGFAVTGLNAGTNLGLLVSNNTATGYSGFNEDTNRNNVFDPGEDANGNGVLDQGTAFEITARNGAVINANAPLAAQPLGVLNNIESNSGTGLLLNSVNGSVLNVAVQGNQFNDNVSQFTGIKLAANTGGAINFVIDQNDINDNLGNGLALFTRNAGVLNGSITSNNITNNELAAVLIDSNTGFVTINNFTDNNLDRSTAGTAGILINAQNSGIVVNNVLRNLFTAGNANSSFGIGGTVNGGTLGLFVGSANSPNANANTFDSNSDAGIGFDFLGNAVFTASIVGNTITNTSGGANANFAGEGIRFNFNDTSSFVNATPLNLALNPNPNLAGIVRTIDLNTITGNSSFGVNVNATLNAAVDSMVITRNFIDTNDIGVFFTRENAARITNVAITDNILTNDGQDSLRITGSGAGTQDTYTLSRNEMANTTNHGVHIELDMDARLLVNMFNNNIHDNPNSGIFVTQTTNNTLISDVSGQWLGNVITNNGLTGGAGLGNAGIDINARFAQVGTPLQIGALGQDANGFSLGNMIQGNGGAGININGSGQANIVNNLISGNGSVLGTTGAGAGIDLSLTTPATSVINVTDNRILNNLNGDGVELTSLSSDNTVNLLRNTITGNAFRGLDVLNAGAGSTLNLLADSNVITGNQAQGVYIVNSASTTQLQTAANGTTVVATGSVFADPLLNLAFTNNVVNLNGTGLNATDAARGTGFVIRVGTTDSGGTPFASDLGGSGVVALVDNNQFLNNNATTQAIDVAFGSFVSTVAPSDLVDDPLARFDLIFSNNNVGVIDTLNTGAAYTNASTVKSSLAVFTSTTRPRNATLFSADISNVAGTMTVQNDVPSPNAVAPTGTRWQSTTANNGAQNPVPAGLYNSSTANASEFVTRFIVGPAGLATITTYATPAIGAPTNATRSDFTVTPAYGAVAAGNTFQVDYLRVAGIGLDTTYNGAHPTPLNPASGAGTFRFRDINNTFGTVINDFGDSVSNLNPLQNGQLFDRPFQWFDLP